MSEHEHPETKEQAPHHHLPADPSLRPARIIASSIVVGAVLVMVSVLYGFRLVVKNLPVSLSGPSAVAPAGQAAITGQTAPTGPVNVAARDDEPALGNKNAKVTMVEFGDFQCPYCKNFEQDTYPQIKSQYIDTGKVKLVFRHYPLPFHVNAQISAVAAECANRQGKFWDYHDLLYKNGQDDGTGLDKASLEKYADSLGLNKGTLGLGTNKFNQCLDSNATLTTVQNDTAEGNKDGVTGTPTFFINGQVIVGAQPFATFQQALDSALNNS
ncbi:MAG TPA: DsbA family protein [Patescibacteria group bacterium]|nr:DsbA family protein [Patescibacteria group bacterium]